jgi:hypothetical protein
MEALLAAWGRVAPWQRMVLGAALAGCTAWVYTDRRIQPVREEVRSLRMTLREMEPTTAQERTAPVEKLRTQLASLRARNEDRLRVNDEEGQRAVLAMLGRIDELIRASRMILIRRHDPEAKRRGAPHRRSARPHGRPGRPAQGQEDRLQGLPPDIRSSAYRHEVSGGFLQALQLLAWLNALEVPCEIREIVVQSRDQPGARASVILKFTAIVYFRP